MNDLTKQQVSESILDDVAQCDPDLMDTDNDGQLVIYTGLYRWADGSYHSLSEKEGNDEETSCPGPDSPFGCVGLCGFGCCE